MSLSTLRAPRPSPGPQHAWRSAGLSFASSVVAAAVLWDRWAWAGLSEWGGDPGIVMHLARAGSWSVGALNSHGDPNPNGLILAGSVLLLIGDLRVASFVLSLAQALAVCGLALSLTRNRADAFLLAQPLLWCSTLRAVSTEFWAQWVLATLATISVTALLRHIRRPHVGWLAVSLASACLSAAAYLPGAVTLIVMCLLWGARVARLPRAEWRRHLIGGVLPVFLLFALVVAIPFLRVTDLSAIQPGISRGPGARLAHALIEPLRALPAMFGDLWHHFPRSLRPGVPGLASWELGVLTAAMAVGVAAEARARRRPVDLARAGLRHGLAFFLGIFVVSPLLTGYALTRDYRLDQAFQAVPLLLALCFAAGLGRVSAGRRSRLGLLARLLAIVFAVSQAWSGSSLREAIRAGREMTNTPHLGEVRAVADRLAREVPPGASSPTLAVEYREGLDWFPEFLRSHQRWHGVRMTGGEVFDSELLARGRVGNVCTPDCPATGPRYLVDWGPSPRETGGIPVWTSSNRRIRIERYPAPTVSR